MQKSVFLVHFATSYESAAMQSFAHFLMMKINGPAGCGRTEIRCLAVDKARMNSTVPCTLGHRIENKQLRLSTVADALRTIL
jgi:hypothetical protein